MEAQGELRLDGGGPAPGLEAWRKARRDASHALAQRLGLPLNHPVEVWLRGGIRLRGILRLREAPLFHEDLDSAALFLTVDHVPFKAEEIESCVRLD
jgi:hypothetical protein